MLRSAHSRQKPNIPLDFVAKSDIIKLYYGLGGEPPYSLEEIGKLFSLTRERVRQIKEKAIKRLKLTSRNKILKSYLGD